MLGIEPFDALKSWTALVLFPHKKCTHFNTLLELKAIRIFSYINLQEWLSRLPVSNIIPPNLRQYNLNHFIRYSFHTWLSSGLIIVSSALKVFPNMEYVSWITGGGLGARPLLIFSSVYWLIYCTGGSGNELTWAVSDAILLTMYIIITYWTFVKLHYLSLVALIVLRPHSTLQHTNTKPYAEHTRPTTNYRDHYRLILRWRYNGTGTYCLMA
jgi:hypothetical protein